MSNEITFVSVSQMDIVLTSFVVLLLQFVL